MITKGSILLRAALDAAGIQATTAAPLVHADGGMISHWLSGNRLPSIRHAAAIERIFDVPCYAWALDEAGDVLPVGRRNSPRGAKRGAR